MCWALRAPRPAAGIMIKAPRDRNEVTGYLGPKLSRLEQALEAERIRVQATGV